MSEHRRTKAFYRNVKPPRTLGDTVALATSTDPARVALQHIHHQDGLAIGADGFRMHIAPSADPACVGCGYPEYKWVIPTKHTYQAVVNRLELRTAAVRAGIFAREEVGKACILANGRIEVSALSDTGRTETVVECVSEGKDIALGVNYAFLIDALDHVGGETVTIELSAPDQIIAIKNGDRLALVMPMML